MMDFIRENGRRISNAVETAGLVRVGIALGLFAVLIAAVFFFFFQSQPVRVELEFVDSDGNPVSGVQVRQAGGSELPVQSDSAGRMELVVPRFSEVVFLASKPGWNAVEKRLAAKDADIRMRIVLVSLSDVQVREFGFAGLDNKKITGSVISGMLSCANASFQPDPRRFEVLSESRVRVSTPKDCGALVVSVLLPSGFAGFSYAIPEGGGVVKIKTTQSAFSPLAGSIELSVTGENREPLRTGRFTAHLLREDAVVQSVLVSKGKAVFSSVPPGRFTLLVHDENAHWGDYQSEFVVESRRKKTVSVSLAPSENRLSVHVLDAASRQPLENARVGLTNPLKGVVGLGLSDARGMVFFGLEENAERDLVLDVFLEGFLFKRIPVQSVNNAQEVLLAKSSDGPEFRVKVVDSLGAGIENARVFLLDPESRTVLQGIPVQATSADGIAVFSGAPGSVWVKAEKGFLSGEIIVPQTGLARRPVEVVLSPKKGVLEVSVQDESQKAVSDAVVTVFSKSGEVLTSTKTPADGAAVMELESGQEVMVRVSHDAYGVLDSESIFVSENQEWTAVLVRRARESEIEIRFAGFSDESGEPVETLVPGESYRARFWLRVPEGMSKAGAFFSIGNQTKAEDEAAAIVHVDSGLGEAVMGTHLDEASGTGIDLAEENISFDSAKWGQIVFDNPDFSIQEIALLFEVKSGSFPDELLQLNYRAWGKRGDRIETAPKDFAASGDAPSRELLYADTFYETIPVSEQASECGSGVCLKEFRIETSLETRTLEPFRLEAGESGALFFKIQNTSNTKLEELEMGIFGGLNGADLDAVGILEIRVNQETVPAQISGSESVYSFDLKAQETTSVWVFIAAKSASPAPLRVQIRKNGSVLAEREVLFEDRSLQSLRLELEPTAVPALSSQVLSARVLDAESGMGIGNALVRVSRIGPDGFRTETSAVSDDSGNAEFELPALPAGTILTLTAEKTGFHQAVETLRVSEMIRFEPDELNVQLDVSSQPSETIPVAITNLTDGDARVTETFLGGSFEGVLDLDAMQNGFSDFSGTTIPGGKRIVSSFFSATLEDGIRVDAPFSISGSQWIELQFEEDSFVFALPVHLEVSPSGSLEPDGAEENCLSLSNTRWTGTTIENRSDFAFVLKNECQTNLGGLFAKIVWNKPSVGSIELGVNDLAPVALNENQWIRMLDSFPTDGFSGVMTLTPTQTDLGEAADFTVYLAGENPDGSKRFAPPILGNILVANLEQCLVYTPHPKAGILVPYGEKTVFSMDASNCGDIELEIELCQGDPGCSGDASEGTIRVSPLKFELDETRSVMEVSVEGVDLPGAYDITVWAKTPRTDFAQVGSLAARVQTNPDAFFELEKFEFFLKEAGQTDTTRVINRNLSTRVNVVATAADWAELDPADVSGFDAAGTGITPEGINNLDLALAEAHRLTAARARETAQKVEEAQQLSEQALDQQNQAGDDTGQAQSQIGTALNGASQAANLAQTLTTSCNAANVALDCQALCPGQIPAACAAAQSIFGAMKTAFGGIDASATVIDSAVDSVGESKITEGTGYAKEPASPIVSSSTLVLFFQAMAQNAVDAANNGLSQINGAEEAAAVDKSQNLSDGAREGSEQSASSCQSNILASQKDQEGQQDTQSAGTNLGMAGAGIAMSVTQAGVMESALAGCTCSAVTPLRTKFYAFKGAQTGLQGSASAASGDTDTAKDSQQTAELASNSASAAACAASESLNNFADASEQLADDIAGENQETTQNLAVQVSGGVTGGYLDGIYDAGDLVTNSLTGFVINLKNDAKNVEVESLKVSGAFEVSGAQVSGEYRTQTAGIAFENKSLGEETVFSVVTLNSDLHEYKDPADAKGKDFGPYRLEEIGTTESYQQKFHLKFSGEDKPQTLAGAGPDAVLCQSGSLLGRTGPDAVPRIALRWNWRDISMDACDAKNPEYVYCDATQFSIMVSKRLHALDEFLNQNQGLACPTNNYEVNLNAEVQPFQSLGPTDGFSASEFIPDCWLPKTTRLFDQKAALEYFVEATDNIQWTDAIPDQSRLHDLLFFDAYLIQDGFTSDFKRDFSDYFSDVSLLDTPTYFFGEITGKNLNRFFEEDKISFIQKFGDSDRIPASGLYAVELNVDFETGQWLFFSSDAAPAASAEVALLSREQSLLNDPFYFLPFDGEVGLENNRFERGGYGVAYEVSDSEILRISRQEQVLSRPNAQGGLKRFAISKRGSFPELNSIASRRGFILDVVRNSNGQSSAVFSPSVATPVLLKVTRNESRGPFSVLYSLRTEEKTNVFGENLAFWQGAGQCKDFDGEPVQTRWVFEPDRRGKASDRVAGFEQFYGMDWAETSGSGSVFLKTLFFAPINSDYSLKAETSNAVFETPDDPQSNSVRLSGIKSMPFNRTGQTASDKITALDDLFDLVREETVCVTNTGVRTSFWWNPRALFEQAGESGKSVSDIESTLESGKTCR